MTKEELLKEYEKDKYCYWFVLEVKDHIWYNNPSYNPGLDFKHHHYCSDFGRLVRSHVLPETFRCLISKYNWSGYKNFYVY